jgi:hypothetical protein
MARVLLVMVDFMYHGLTAANVIEGIFGVVGAGQAARQVERRSTMPSQTIGAS